jgi:hypothetical protein
MARFRAGPPMPGRKMAGSVSLVIYEALADERPAEEGSVFIRPPSCR